MLYAYFPVFIPCSAMLTCPDYQKWKLLKLIFGEGDVGVEPKCKHFTDLILQNHNRIDIFARF